MKLAKVILGAVFGLTLAGIVSAQPTAMNLAKAGNQYVGIQSKDKLLRIYSDKSTGGLAPLVWHVVYFDPDAVSKSIQVRFASGHETDVATAFPMFHLPAKPTDVLDLPKIVVDSDQALSVAESQPALQGLTPSSSALTLEFGDAGPVWKVDLWAAKKKDPSKEAKLGTVTISATDSSTLKADLDPGKVN